MATEWLADEWRKQAQACTQAPAAGGGAQQQMLTPEQAYNVLRLAAKAWLLSQRGAPLAAEVVVGDGGKRRFEMLAFRDAISGRMSSSVATVIQLDPAQCPMAELMAKVPQALRDRVRRAPL